jgi:hypothetical protein
MISGWMDGWMDEGWIDDKWMVGWMEGLGVDR